MYKRIVHSNNEIEIQEHFKRPMVYLNHWALNDISHDQSLRENFVNTMNHKGGTFRLSITNFVELTRQKDKNQINSILSMIKSIPDCGLINIDAGEVIRRENALISDPNSILYPGNPSAEIEIVSTYLMTHNYPEQWHVSDMIENIINEPFSKRRSESSSKFIEDMQRLINSARNDKKYISKAKSRFKKLKNNGPKYQRPTREIQQLSFYFIIRNQELKMQEYSEWEDLFHVVVPVSYCDVVLIDKRWKAFVSQTGYSYPQIAKVYDKKSIGNFFQTLETWKE